MRSVRILFQSVVIALLAALAASPASSQQYDGFWLGTSGQNRTVSFDVSNSAITNLQFGAQTTQPSSCSIGFTVTASFPTPPSITGNTFTITESRTNVAATYTISGTFSSSSAASGTFSFNTNPNIFGCAGSGSTTWTATKAGGPPAPSSTLSRILVVAGSTPGAFGSFFKTSVQIHNPGTSSIAGRFVLHPANAPGTDNDPGLSYSLAAGETLEYSDLLPAMGRSGLGSIDLLTTSGPAPITVARIYNDAGDLGTTGMGIDALELTNALGAGEEGVLIAPAAGVNARLNIGIRTLAQGASLMISVRDKRGAVRNTVSKTYSPTYFEQVAAPSLLGIELGASDTIRFSINSGSAIIYGAATDNKTQDPTLQYARKTR